MSEQAAPEQDVISIFDLQDITTRQVDALHRLRSGSEPIVIGSSRKMYERMRDRGYVEGPPFKITEKGRNMVARFYG